MPRRLENDMLNLQNYFKMTAKPTYAAEDETTRSNVTNNKSQIKERKQMKPV